MKSIITLGFAIVASVFLSACFTKKTSPVDTSNTPVVENPEETELIVTDGDTIDVMYVGALENGEIFDTNIVEKAKEANIYDARRPYTALTFTVGQRRMIPGFDKGVVGMKIGETKKITIPAVDGYGEVRQDLIQTFPVSTFDEAGIDWQSRQVGESYNFDSLQGTITEKTEENITIDFNHFLAGKTLVFDVTVKNISR